MRETLNGVLAADLPNLVQMDVSLLAGLLAERLLGFTPWLDKVFFANSGTEAVRGGDQIRARARRAGPGSSIASDAFHGLTYGALSLNGDSVFSEGFEPLVPGFAEVPFNDLAALEQRARRAATSRRSSSSRSRARA